ncbi:MAG: tetratricopeptide repeat protein [Bacteroidales bacterium]|nr:tetratricopeptide repeat protein [Bacteroidales bacterium]
MKLILTLYIGIAITSALFSQPTYIKPLADSAFLYYKNGNYKQSLHFYHQIEDSGYTSASMYYNMGNAYFRLNEIAKAILYFERAKLLNPNDQDIIHNLKYANTFVSDKINELPEPFYITWYRTFAQFFSPNTWAWIAILLFVVMLILIYINFLTTSVIIARTIKFFIIVILLVWITSIFTAYYSYRQVTAHKYAIIMTESIEIKSSPDENSTSLFVLHEGTKVYIKEIFEDWAEIKIADGNTGWIKLKYIEQI